MYQRILVPVDGSPTSDRGLDEAIRLARLTNGSLRLLHVVDELTFALSMEAYAGRSTDWPSELRAIGVAVLDKAQAVAEAAAVVADTALYDSFKGSVQEIVTAEAALWPADLIVIGTHGRRGVERFVMGSSAEQVCRLSTVPVLLVRSPEATVHEATSEKLFGLYLPGGVLASE
ncbi:MAG: universal stress protein [Burkholderiaceae bacterium]